jgi:hypothetical protein
MEENIFFNQVFSGDQPSENGVVIHHTSTLMMEADVLSEMLARNSILTRLIARKHFTAFSRRQSFKLYHTFSFRYVEYGS